MPPEKGYAGPGGSARFKPERAPRRVQHCALLCLNSPAPGTQKQPQAKGFWRLGLCRL